MTLLVAVNNLELMEKKEPNKKGLESTVEDKTSIVRVLEMFE